MVKGYRTRLAGTQNQLHVRNCLHTFVVYRFPDLDINVDEEIAHCKVDLA